MSTFSIRLATSGDIPTLSALGARTFRETYRTISDPGEVEGYANNNFTADRIEGWLATPQSCTLLASVDNVAVGYAHVRRHEVPECVEDRRAVQLSRLYLLACAHGMGAGAALMRRSLDEVARLGGQTVWLGVYEKNLKALDFYAAWGFVQTGTFPFQFGGLVYQDPVLERPVAVQAPGERVARRHAADTP